MDENLITPTQNIAFAAMKDGSFISNLKEGGKTNPMYISQIFSSLRDMVNTMEKVDLAIFAFVYLLEARVLQDCIQRKIEAMRD